MNLLRMASACALFAALTGAAQAQTPAVDGKAAYEATCAACHGAELEGGTGPALKGETFVSHWGAPHAPKELFSRLRTTMPVGAPGSLTAAQYAAITLYLMGQNGIAASPPAAAPAAGPR